MIESDVFGVFLLLFSLACLGTWPALLRLCSLKPDSSLSPSSSTSSCLPPLGSCGSAFYRIDLQRNLCHVYLDYSLSYFLVSCLPLLLAILLSEESLIASIPISLIAVAMLGGSLLSMGNLSLQWATSVYGAPLTTVLAIQASLTVVLGTSLNYLLEPSKTERPTLLFVGVLVFLLAIALATKAQIMYAQQQQNKDVNYTEIEMQYGSNLNLEAKDSNLTDSESITIDTTTLSPCESTTTSPVNHRKDPSIGIMVAVVGGLCFGFFSPAFNIAVNDPFQWTPVDTTLSVARANLWFSASFWLASVIGNTLLLRRQDQEQQQSEQSVLHVLVKYATQDSLLDRQLALMAGFVCALGNIMQFQGGQLVGYATADLVQAYPLVSTLWDIFLFHEFTHVRCPSSLGLLLVGMYMAYLSGIVLLAGSSFSG